MPSPESDDNHNAGPRPGLLDIAGDTHVGCVRDVNQDAYGDFEDMERGEKLLVVADGLGGHLGGEVASQLAVDMLGKTFRVGDGTPADRLRDAIAATNREILTAARNDLALDGMGTTVVCLLVTGEGQAYVGHVGDSRLYRLRDGRLDALTEDHSLVATLVSEGVLTPEEAWSDPRRNQIMQALGIREEIDIVVAPVEILPGDAYLLCSDGLNGLVVDDDIRDITNQPEPPEGIVNELIQAALHAGGTDNVTCMLARFREPGGLRATASQILEKTRSILRPLQSR